MKLIDITHMTNKVLEGVIHLILETYLHFVTFNIKLTRGNFAEQNMSLHMGQITCPVLSGVSPFH